MKLLEFQRAGVAFLVKNRRALLCDPMGTGKTAQLIRTLQVLQNLGQNPFPALVVCPNSLKLSTWSEELSTWAPELLVQVIDGSAIHRRKQLAIDADVKIINWESIRLHSRIAGYGTIALTDREKEPKELNELGFRTVIADEVHKAKDAKAAQTRALWALMHDAEFRFGATGTPTADNIGDLWSLLHGIEPGWFPAKTKYLDYFADTSLNYFGGFEVHGIHPQHRDDLFKVIDPLIRRIPKEAALPHLPPKLPMQIRHTPMSPKQLKAYEQMRDDMIAHLNDILVAPNPLSQLTRLAQFAAASADMVPVVRRETRERLVYTDEWYEDDTGKRRRHVLRDDNGQAVTEKYVYEYDDFDVRLSIPSSKVDDLVDLLEEMGEEPLVVAAVSRQLIELAATRLGKLKISYGLVTGAQSVYERQQSVTRFQDGKIRVILLTLGAGAEGITLTRAATMLFMQESYSEIQNAQAQDRIHRIGSEIHDGIQIIKQVTPDSIEETKLKILATKRMRMEEVVRDKATLLELLGGAA